MDFETIKSGFNELFAALGMEIVIPEHVTDDETFQMWIKDAVSLLKPEEDNTPEDGNVDAPASTPAETLPEQTVAASLSKQLSAAITTAMAPVIKQLSSVQAELQGIKSEKQLTAKTEFEGRLKELGIAGLPGKEAQRLSALGQRYSYDLALLAGAEHLPGIDMGRVAKKHRDGSAPAVPGDNGQQSDDEVEAELKLRGINPDKMPHFQRR